MKRAGNWPSLCKRRFSRVEVLNVGDVKADWCKNGTHKVEDSIVEKIEFSLKKKYTALTLPTSSVDELGINAFQFTASRF